MNKDQIIEEVTARINSGKDRIMKDYGQTAVNDFEVRLREVTNKLEQLQQDQVEATAELKAEIDGIISEAEITFS